MDEARDWTAWTSSVLSTPWPRVLRPPGGTDDACPSAVGEETDTLEDVYEPYLLQLGLIQRTPRGRIVTKLGREHVGAAKRAEALF